MLIAFCFLENIGESSYVLIETESFDSKGGWVVDPQFGEQMGSPYLLAHGLGIPVENASKKVVFPAIGNYHIWARTKNWVPGEWEAPGQFKIIVDHVEMNKVLGTKSGWNWEYAGKISIEQDTVIIEVNDLTGFEGRCDAIYFCTKKQSPPNDSAELACWRKINLGETDLPDRTANFDLIIVGGGIAGCAASIAAAEQGLNIALIHDRPILGGNASSEIRVHTEGIPWHSERILSMINTVWWPNGSPDSKKDDLKRHKNIEKYSNINLFLNWRAYNTLTVNDTIRAVFARHTATGETKQFKAPLFIDCTGDGWIGFWSGAEIMYGREAAAKYNENWQKEGENWSPTKKDNSVMGSSVLWRTTSSDTNVTFPIVPWAMDMAKDYSATMGTWQWEFS